MWVIEPQAFCVEYKMHLKGGGGFDLKALDNELILCKLIEKGDPRKVVGCSCVAFGLLSIVLKQQNYF